MVPIQHTRDAVEPESVQMIFFHPELAVGQEEIFGFTLSVVEASGAPRRMMSLGPLIEIQVFPAVEQAEPFRLIVHAVGMDDIHHDGYAAGMCIIHKMFEFLRCSESGRKCVEVGNLVSEGAVIRVLLQGHNLDGVVAKCLDMRKNIDTELFEGGDFFIFGTHAYVALVNQRMRSRTRPGVLPLILFVRFPHLGAEHLGDRVLHYPPDVGREPFSAASRPFDEEFVEFLMVEEHGGQADFPVSAADRIKRIGRRASPVVELAYEVYPAGIGSPLTEDPASVGIPVQAIVQMVVQPVGKGAVKGNLVALLQYSFMTLLYGFLVWSQIRVGLVYLLHNPGNFSLKACKPRGSSSHIHIVSLVSHAPQICAALRNQFLGPLHIGINIIKSRSRVLDFSRDFIQFLNSFSVIKFIHIPIR